MFFLCGYKMKCLLVISSLLVSCSSFDLLDVNRCINFICSTRQILTSPYCRDKQLFWSECLGTCLDESRVSPGTCLDIQFLDFLLKKYLVVTEEEGVHNGGVTFEFD